MPSYILVLLLNVIIALVPICMCRLVSAAIMRLHCIRVLIAVIILKPLVLVLVALAAMLSRSLLVGSIRRVRDVIIADLLSLLARGSAAGGREGLLRGAAGQPVDAGRILRPGLPAGCAHIVQPLIERAAMQGLVALFACMPPLAAVVAAEPDRLRRQHRFAAQVAQASAAAAPHSLQIPPGVLLPAPALRPDIVRLSSAFTVSAPAAQADSCLCVQAAVGAVFGHMAWPLALEAQRVRASISLVPILGTECTRPGSFGLHAVSCSMPWSPTLEAPDPGFKILVKIPGTTQKSLDSALSASGFVTVLDDRHPGGGHSNWQLSKLCRTLLTG